MTEFKPKRFKIEITTQRGKYTFKAEERLTFMLGQVSPIPWLIEIVGELDASRCSTFIIPQKIICPYRPPEAVLEIRPSDVFAPFSLQIDEFKKLLLKVYKLGYFNKLEDSITVTDTFIELVNQKINEVEKHLQARDKYLYCYALLGYLIRFPMADISKASSKEFLSQHLVLTRVAIDLAYEILKEFGEEMKLLHRETRGYSSSFSQIKLRLFYYYTDIELSDKILKGKKITISKHELHKKGIKLIRELAKNKVVL